VTATSRRALLGAGLAAALAGCTGDDDPDNTSGDADSGSPGPSADPAFDPSDWTSVQEQFPLDPAMAQFAAFVLSPHTRALDAAIGGYRDELARDTEQALLDGLGREDVVRAAAATYAGGTAGQYALTDSTTMGLGLMYGGLTLSPGDEILTTTHDFYSTEESLRLLAARTDARIRRVTLYDDPSAATVDEMVEQVIGAITPRTKLVAVTWVHSGTGVRVPVREIASAMDRLERVPRTQYLFCVDGVHGFSAVDVDLPDLGCDFLASGTHKWLFGPRGTGILWGRDWAPLTEVIPTFSGPGPAARVTPGGYHDFEHRWALADAFAFMTSIGRDRVAARTAEQATALKEGLTAIDAVTVKTPLDPEVSAGIVCVDVAGMPPANAVLSLREAGIVASATPYATSYLRLGPSIATSPEQVEHAVGAVAGLV
jgi:selenocysteine lyase/cysteine desulfurase